MKKLLSIALSAAMLVSMGSFAASAEEESLSIASADTNVLTIDFEGNGETAVDETAVSAISSDNFSVARTWLADDVSPENKGISIAGSNADYTYAAASSIGGNEGHALALSAPANISSYTATNYLNIQLANTVPTANRSAIEIGKDGYIDFSFDFYPSRVCAPRVALSYLNKKDSATSNSTAWGKTFFEIAPATGKITMFNAGNHTYEPYTAAELETKYFGKWHNVRCILTGMNKYQVIFDGVALNDFKKMNLTKNSSWEDSSSFLKGLAEIRFYNIGITGNDAYTNYFDNIKYGTGSDIVNLGCTNGDVRQRIADNKTSAPKMYANADWSVSSFLNGLSGTYIDEEITGFSVIDANGDEIDPSSTMADAAKLRLVTASGVAKALDVVTDITTIEMLRGSDTAIKSDSTWTASYAGSHAAYKDWVLPNDYVQKGVTASYVAGIGGKADDDEALQITADAAADSYLDLWMQSTTTRVDDAHAPLVAECSVYIPDTFAGTFDFQIERPDATTRTLARVRNGKLLDGSNKELAEFEYGKWNRLSVMTFPNASEYKIYLNGKYVGKNSTNLAPTYIRRYRFRLNAVAANDSVIIDDVTITKGAYTPNLAVDIISSDGSYTAYAVPGNGEMANLTSAMLIFAEYNDDGTLKQVKAVEGEPTMGDDLQITLDDVTTDIIKAFLWDKHSLNPLDTAHDL